jgi:hypothetical protein
LLQKSPMSLAMTAEAGFEIDATLYDSARCCGSGGIDTT